MTRRQKFDIEERHRVAAAREILLAGLASGEIKQPEGVDIGLPKIGSDIYVGTSMYIDRGEDDFAGGLCTVSEISKMGRNWFVSVLENPGGGYNWEILLEQQSELREEHGTQRGHRDPDWG